MKEDKYINLIKSSLPESAGYIGDDTAYISEKDLILTQDTLIEDVHFRRSTISPYDLGIKSIAVNLSDIAASGGVPGYALISLSLPENLDTDFVELFYKGVREISKKYGLVIVGGDLTRAEKITISIALIGFGEELIPAKRSNARVDDLVITTGKFGSSVAGLWLLETGKSELLKDISQPVQNKFIKSHINPVPKLEAGRTILKTCKKTPAMMDTSDGLADALYKISLQSNVSMEIDYKDVPVDKDLYTLADVARVNPFKWIFYGGEDYELIATVSKQDFEDVKQQGVPVKVIGKVIPSNNNPAVYVKIDDRVVKIDSQSLDKEVFSHFKDV